MPEKFAAHDLLHLFMMESLRDQLEPDHSARAEAFVVLLADDDPSFRSSVHQALDMLGFFAREVSSGNEALSLLKKKTSDDPIHIDLAIVDIRMEDGDGIEFIETLRTSDIALPVILMSAYPAESLLDRARAAGFTRFLVKPFSLEELSEAIIAAIAETRGRTEK